MSKIMDRQGRLFGKISIIDLLVILVVVVLAVALYMKRNVMEHTSPVTPTTSIVYEVKIPGVRNDILEMYQIGDEVYDTDNNSGSPIGTITDIRTEPYQIGATYTDGTYNYPEVEGRSDVYLTLEGQGLITDGRYYVNRTYEVNVNSYRNIHTKYVVTECVITEILS